MGDLLLLIALALALAFTLDAFGDHCMNKLRHHDPLDERSQHARAMRALKGRK